jgi:hypothetical protein
MRSRHADLSFGRAATRLYFPYPHHIEADRTNLQ